MFPDKLFLELQFTGKVELVVYMLQPVLGLSLPGTIFSKLLIFIKSWFHKDCHIKSLQTISLPEIFGKIQTYILQMGDKKKDKICL